MAVSLRPYQAQLLEDIRTQMRLGHRRILAVMPTGAGKGTTIAFMVSEAARRGHRVLILAHRAELIADLSQRIHGLGINHGILANGYREDLRHPVQVGSVQTVVRRLSRIPPPSMVIQDEAHHLVTGNMWGRIIDAWPRAFLIGKTATPQRLSGEGLGMGHGGFFTAMVLGPDAAWLTQHGFLVPARVFAPPGIDLSGIRRFDTAKGRHEADDRLQQGQAMGDAVSHYRRTIEPEHNGTAIAFCCSVAHADALAEAFRSQGIAAARLDGTMDRGERRRLINDLGAGVLKVLTSCDIISEGTDIPSVTGAILLRPTDSLGLHLQQVGRVLRPAPGKTCLLRGTLVLTDRGIVPIERVTIDHKVWDGLEFVQHSGAICQGRKAVITHDGITATPDHLVMTLHGWQQLAQAKAHGWRIVNSGAGRRPIRISAHLFQEHDRNVLESAGRRDLHEVRVDRNGPLSQHEKREECLRRMCTAQVQDQGLYLALQTLSVAKDALQQSVECGVSQLRRQGDQVQVPISMARSRVDCRTPWSPPGQEGPDRQDRQQQSLRARQPPLGLPADQLPQHQNEYRCDCALLGVSGQASGSEIRGCNAQKAMHVSHGRSNHCPMEHSFPQTEGEVWDILNAGPRNCFTANDRLVHNCAIINDHVGNSLRHGLPTDPRQWSLDGQQKRKRAASDALPVKVCDSCFSTLPSAEPTCPVCGFVFPAAARRELMVVDGNLQELEASVIARQKRHQVAQARTREELEAIRLERGYSRGWTDHILRARGNHGTRAFG